MRKRARIIYNPTSGKELFKRTLPDVLIKLLNNPIDLN